MNIKGKGNSIIVETKGKTVIIDGELTITPAFYADADSIKHWEPPYDDIMISEEEKQELIKEILDYNKDQEVKIIFD